MTLFFVKLLLHHFSSLSFTMGASLSVLDPMLRTIQLLSHESTQQLTTAPATIDLRSFIEVQLSSVLNELNYATPAVTENSAIWEGMRLYADKTGVPYDEGTHSGKCFKVGYNYPVVSITSNYCNIMD